MIPPIHAKRVQMFFTDGRYEWSEVYYREEGVPVEDALNDALTNLAPVRVRCLAEGVQLVEIRASDDAVFRDSLVDESYQGWQRPPGAVPGQKVYNPDFGGVNHLFEAADPSYVLRLRQQAEPGAPENPHVHRRIVYMSGIPKICLQDQGNMPNGKRAEADQAFNSFKAYLESQSSRWGFVVTKNPPEQSANITGIVRDPITGIVTVNHDGGLTFGANSTVEVFKPAFFPGSLKIQGHYNVKTSVPGQFTTLDLRAGTVQYFNGGKVYSLTRKFVLIRACIFDGFHIRKRGAAELAPRGRSRARKSFAG